MNKNDSRKQKFEVVLPLILGVIGALTVSAFDITYRADILRHTYPSAVLMGWILGTLGLWFAIAKRITGSYLFKGRLIDYVERRDMNG